MLTRTEAEDFLYAEADLLDSWRLEEWLDLFSPDAQYWVPSTDQPNGKPDDTLFLIADDMARLRARVKRLLSVHAHAESPHSRTRRMISNVRVDNAGDEILIRSNFVVYRFRGEAADQYVGHYEHGLVGRNGALKIRMRKAILDMEALRPVGKVSIIL